MPAWLIALLSAAVGAAVPATVQWAIETRGRLAATRAAALIVHEDLVIIARAVALLRDAAVSLGGDHAREAAEYGHRQEFGLRSWDDYRILIAGAVSSRDWVTLGRAVENLRHLEHIRSTTTSAMDLASDPSIEWALTWLDEPLAILDRISRHSLWWRGASPPPAGTPLAIIRNSQGQG